MQAQVQVEDGRRHRQSRWDEQSSNGDQGSPCSSAPVQLRHHARKRSKRLWPSTEASCVQGLQMNMITLNTHALAMIIDAIEAWVATEVATPRAGGFLRLHRQNLPKPLNS